ncbi:MAG: hypothetical protein ACOCX4_05010 [Planctomycetota bacterium]
MDPNETTEVLLLTSHYRITGRIALVPGARLTDYIDEDKPFFPITKACVTERSSGRQLLQAHFLDVNRESVEIILPRDAVTEEEPA